MISCHASPVDDLGSIDVIRDQQSQSEVTRVVVRGNQRFFQVIKSHPEASKSNLTSFGKL
jgi:hypothetical protein